MYIDNFSDTATVTTYYVGNVTTSDKPGNCNTSEREILYNFTFITSMCHVYLCMVQCFTTITSMCIPHFCACKGREKH